MRTIHERENLLSLSIGDFSLIFAGSTSLNVVLKKVSL